MKEISLIIVIITCITTTCIRALAGENMISDVIMQNGKEYGFNHIFDGSGALEFSLNNSNLNGKWKCSIKTSNEEFLDIPIEVSSNICCFDPSKVNFKTWNEEAFRKYDALKKQDYFILKISYLADYDITEEREFIMQLLPKRLTISNVIFDYEYNWEDDYIAPNGYIHLDVESEGASRFDLYFTHWHLFTDERLFFGYLKQFNTKNRIHIQHDTDWGEYISFCAFNNYGYVRSDTICTTNYIYDEKILARIEELKRQAAVNDIEQDSKSSYAWDGDVLRFDSEVNNITVFTLDGRNICRLDYGQEIDLTHLLPGLYIVNYKETITGKSRTTKILKK